MANLRTNNLCGEGFVSANDGTTWSSLFDGSTLGSYPVTNAFDGSTSTFMYPAAGTTITWTAPNGGIKGDLIEVYVYAGNTHPIIEVNGVSTGAVVGSDLGQQGNWVDVTTLVGGNLKTITSFGETIGGVARQSGFSAVRINGEILIDGKYGTTGGRQAIKGSVYFGERYTFLQLDGSSDFAFGTSDFTIEAWIKIDDDTNTNTIYDSRPSGSNGAQIALFYSGSSNAILFAHGGTVRITGTVDVGADHSWHHIALTRASGSTKLFVDGVQDGSTYSDSTSYENPANRPFIGQSGGSTNLAADTFFKGYISNLRVCAGHAVYSSNFTPPYQELDYHYLANDNKTVLLCCQDSNDPTQEVTGKTIVANGLTSFVNRTDNLIKNGDFGGSATEFWTLTGGSAVLGTGQSGTFNDGNHVTLTASSSYAYLKQAFTTVVGRTYRVNAQSNGGDASFISTSTSESDAVLTDIRAVAADDGATKFFVATQTTYHVILRGNTGGANFDTVSVHEQENLIPPKVIPQFGVDAGNTFNGAISMNSTNWMYFPTGKTEERGRGRGVLFGGYESPIGYLDNIYYVQIQSMGNAIDFGSLTLSRYSSGGCGSSTRGLCGGGRKSNGDRIDIIESVEIATTSNSVDFGDLTDNRGFVQGGSNQTRGLFIGGSDPSQTFDIIDYVTIASRGNAQDFGDITVGMSAVGVTQSPTRALAMGGYDGSSHRDIIEYVTIATTGDATDFGDLTADKSQGTAVSSGTRAVHLAGVASPGIHNIIDFVTIATTGNATDFGDTLSTYEHTGSVDNSIRGVITGARTPSYINILESIIIATTGNSTDFGDIPRNGIGYIAGTSDSHGGLT